MAHPKRRVFFSFHYQEDAWRAAQIRNARTIEGNEPVSDNNWEQVKRGGERAIRRWIDMQLETRSCLVVLVGAHTAERKWVNYEIQQAWKLGKGLVGVRIDRLKDRTGQQNRLTWKYSRESSTEWHEIAHPANNGASPLLLPCFFCLSVKTTRSVTSSFH